jgi:hypothetical protein
MQVYKLFFETEESHLTEQQADKLFNAAHFVWQRLNLSKNKPG